MTIDIYYIQGSPPSRTVLMAARHLSIPLNEKVLTPMSGEQKTPEFLKMNPQHQAPVIDDDGFCLGESRAIMRYFVNKYAPDSPLYPQDSKERANVDRILDFDSSTLSRCLIDVVLRPYFMNGTVTDEQKDSLKDALEVFSEYLSRTSYAAADHLTIADLSIFSFFTTCEKIEFDFSPYPKIVNWMEKLKAELPYHKEINEDQMNEASEKFKKMCEQKQQ